MVSCTCAEPQIPRSLGSVELNTAPLCLGLECFTAHHHSQLLSVLKVRMVLFVAIEEGSVGAQSGKGWIAVGGLAVPGTRAFSVPLHVR